MTATRVILADDHIIVRQGLKSLLEAEPGFVVVGEAQDGREAIQLAEKKRPDVVVMDISMPGLNGLEATRQILKLIPGIKIVVLSIHSEPSYVYTALRAGAAGYVLKSSVYNELKEAIAQALRGERYTSPAISLEALDGYADNVEFKETEEEYNALTPRQREILQLIAEGRTRQEIADLLVISPKTVSRHREDLMRTLGIDDDASLVKFALRVGIVDNT